MADSGAKAPGSLRFINPHDDRFVNAGFVPFSYALFADGKRVRIEELYIVVMFFLYRFPVAGCGGDWMLGIDELDIDGFLRAMAAGLKAEVFEPNVGAGSEAMHRTVQMNRWDLLVGLNNPI